MSNTNVAAAAANTAMAQLQTLKRDVQKTRAEAPQVAGTKPFLRLEKTGSWVYGQQNIVVEDGSLWAINPLSFRQGWVCWTDYPKEARMKNEMLNKIMVGLGKDNIPEEELPAQYKGADEWNHGSPWSWSPCMSVELTCLSGEDKGTVVLYDVNSTGGLRQLNEYLSKLEAQIDENQPVAVVKLEWDSYQHNTYGKVVTPVLNYQRWQGLDDTSTPLPEEPTPPAEQAETEQAAPRRRRAAAEEPPTETVASDDAVVGDVADGEPPASTRRRRRPVA